ncbi:MMPL family transporter, partial [Thermodesulfobacteriota bacterium]
MPHEPDRLDGVDVPLFDLPGDLEAANRSAVATTGKAIVFTATTLIAGVIFWFFVDLKFQAEMGLLLALLMFLNMVSALVFIPTLVSIFKPRFICCDAEVCCAGNDVAGASERFIGDVLH